MQEDTPIRRMKMNKFQPAAPWTSPTSSSWPRLRSVFPRQKESASLLCWNNHFSAHRNKRETIWRRRIRSASENLQKQLSCRIFPFVNEFALLNNLTNFSKSIYYTNCTRICWQFGEIAINRLDLFRSHHRIQSAEGVANPPQIDTGRWSSTDSHLPGTFKSSQRVNSRRTGQLGPAEIEASDGQIILVDDDSCYSKTNT